MSKMNIFTKAHIVLYKLLNEGGKQSQLKDKVEYVIISVICMNVALIIVESVGVEAEYAPIINGLRTAFFVFFLIEYILRLWIADFIMKDKKHPIMSRLKYMISFRAVLDLLALLPVMLGSTFIDFRIFRILRLLRITQLKSVNKYTEILSDVIKLKGAQLISSLFIVFIFMLVSAVVIYDLENKAQPHVFQNILSGLWWSMSAFTTVGYGDMYPITPLGRIFGSFMSIFGVFLMAVPIGILTSGFFEISRKNAGNEKHENKQNETEHIVKAPSKTESR